jgi:hypothetical protein
VVVAHLPEQALRLIWTQHDFSTSTLKTADGRPVSILFPGRPNTDSGPDFLDARIRIGRTLFRGDVELHRDAADWHVHGHQQDPRYNSVILQVVQTDRRRSSPAFTASGRQLPLLILAPFLDAAAIHSSLAAQQLRSLPCSLFARILPLDQILHWLECLGDQRFELKIRKLHERLRQLVDLRKGLLRDHRRRYPEDPRNIPVPHHDYTLRDFADRGLWEQLEYEGIMECLGYDKNRERFLALGRAMPLETLRTFDLVDTSTMMAMLFGAGGLLPSLRRVKERESYRYVRTLKRRWKKVRGALGIAPLTASEWLFFRLRPANFPTARLAAFCYLLPALFDDSAFRTLIAIFETEAPSPATMLEQMHRRFIVCPDAYWATHYHFLGSRSSRGVSLGRGRIDDIIVNCLLPLVALYARVFSKGTIGVNCRILAGAHPPLSHNWITRRICTDVFRGENVLKTALLQQGALELYGQYCAPGRCGDCVIGRMIADQRRNNCVS